MPVGFHNNDNNKDRKRDKDKDKLNNLQVVFKSGSCHCFEVDTLEQASAVVKQFLDGFTGRISVDANTVINMADVSAVSINDKCW